MDLLSQGKDGPKEFSRHQGPLRNKGKLVVVLETPIHAKILQHVHSSPEASHMGYHKTLHKARLYFYWLGKRKDIKKVVRECQIFQVNKTETIFPGGIL